jgi:hypothetical protein
MPALGRTSIHHTAQPPLGCFQYFQPGISALCSTLSPLCSVVKPLFTPTGAPTGPPLEASYAAPHSAAAGAPNGRRPCPQRRASIRAHPHASVRDDANIIPPTPRAARLHRHATAHYTHTRTHAHTHICRLRHGTLSLVSQGGSGPPVHPGMDAATPSRGPRLPVACCTAGPFTRAGGPVLLGARAQECSCSRPHIVNVTILTPAHVAHWGAQQGARAAGRAAAAVIRETIVASSKGRRAAATRSGAPGAAQVSGTACQHYHAHAHTHARTHTPPHTHHHTHSHASQCSYQRGCRCHHCAAQELHHMQMAAPAPAPGPAPAAVQPRPAPQTTQTHAPAPAPAPKPFVGEPRSIDHL